VTTLTLADRAKVDAIIDRYAKPYFASNANMESGSDK